MTLQKVLSFQYHHTMRKSISRWVLAVLVMACPLLLLSQQRSDLESKRLKIIAELEIAEEQVVLADKETSTSTKELNAIDGQIRSRENLISNLKKQLSLGLKSITKNKDSLATLDIRLQGLKKTYSKLLNLSHVKNIAADSWLSLFTATNVNDAILRYRYERQFATYLTAKEIEITNLKDAINSVNRSIGEEQDYTQQLLLSEKDNFSKLEKAKQKKKEIVAALTSKSDELKSQLNKKKKERERLNKQIEKIILEELNKRKKTKPTVIAESSFTNKNSLNWPVIDGFISGRFGKQSHPTIKGLKINNNGVDISCKANSNVRSVQKGVVVGVTNIPGFDIMIIIEHGRHYTVYSKMKKANIVKGDKVISGQVIGIVGNDGILHFELWKEKTKLNPEKWLKKK